MLNSSYVKIYHETYKTFQLHPRYFAHILDIAYQKNIRGIIANICLDLLQPYCVI